LHLHLHVDLSAGRRTLVPEGGDEGADKELPCMGVAQDLDPSPAKASPGSLTPSFKIMQLCLLRLCITFQELN
jgi:hypothetical protein